MPCKTGIVESPLTNGETHAFHWYWPLESSLDALAPILSGGKAQKRKENHQNKKKSQRAARRRLVTTIGTGWFSEAVSFWRILEISRRHFGWRHQEPWGVEPRIMPQASKLRRGIKGVWVFVFRVVLKASEWLERACG